VTPSFRPSPTPSGSLLLALVGALALAGCSTTASPLAVLRSDYTRRPVAVLPALPAVDVDSLRATAGRAPIVFLTHERTIEHQFAFQSGMWDFVQDVRQQYVVLDPDEERATTFRLPTDRRDVVEGVYLRVVAPGGQEQTFAMADLIREAGTDGVTYKFAYPNVAAGSVIEESFRLRRSWDRSFQPPLYHDVRLQYDVPVDHLVFRYVYPSSWAIGIKQTVAGRTPAFELDRESHLHYTILTATRENVPAFPDEPFSPFFKEVGPYLEFAVTSIHAGDVLPVYSAPASWEALASTYARYVFKRRGGATGPVAQQARSIADPAQPDSVRLAAIVGWVQQNIEETDERSATDLREALQTRRANALLITGLTQALLEEAGLDADYILVHPASEGYFDPEFVDDRQFTAPAVLVRLEGSDRVVFPYVDGLPVTYLPETYRGALAMRINGEGFGGYVRLPTTDASESAVDEGVDVRVDEEGVVHVEETATLRGAAAFGVREALDDLDAEEREDAVREFVTYDEGAVQGFSYTVEGESNVEAPLVVTLRYTIEDLVTLTPEEVLFQTGGLLSPASLSAFEEAPGARQTPIRVYHDALTTKTITVRYPEAWTLTTPLADVRDETHFGRTSGQYTLAPGLLTATQRVELRQGSAAATDYAALSRLTGSESRLYVPTLVFSVAP
jgi:hypothetical protein